MRFSMINLRGLNVCKSILQTLDDQIVQRDIVLRSNAGKGFYHILGETECFGYMRGRALNFKQTISPSLI